MSQLGLEEQASRYGTLEVSKSGSGTVQVLRIVGELDLANAAELEAEMSEAEREGKMLLLDMRGLEFIDSTGIALLVAAHRRLNDSHALPQRFSVVPSGHEAVCQVLRLTGIDGLLPLAGAEVAAA